MFDAEVHAYAENIRKLGGVVNTAIILGVDEGILGSKDRTLFDALALGKAFKLLGIAKLKLQNTQFSMKL